MVKIVVTEYPRSGGTWLVSLIGGILGFPKRDIYVNDDFNTFDVSMHPWYADAENFDLTENCVIKSHELPNSPLIAFPAKLIHLVRDGRDVSVSKYFYESDFLLKNGFIQNFDTPIDEHIIQTGHDWQHYILAWLATDVPIYRYEDFLHDTIGTLQRLFNDINLDVSRETIVSTVQANTVSNTRYYFAPTFKHNTVVRKGIAGNWRNYLDAYRSQQFVQVAGEALERLGYKPFPNYQNELTEVNVMNTSIQCWCGNSEKFAEFSDDYVICEVCHSLLDINPPPLADLVVKDDETNFYGREYWLTHQTNVLGYPDLYERARLDLPGRCVYWLKTLLKYKTPPGRILELGSAHGAFVGLLKLAGFDAMGLDLSPWVTEYAHRTFEVPMLVGPLEEQPLERESFDIIVLMDVLEHLPDPISTISKCLSLLKADGLIMIQTPEYRELPYEQIVEHDESFLKTLMPEQHLHLFSKRGIHLLFERLGGGNIVFERKLFAYDMLFIAAKTPGRLVAQAQPKVLDATPTARLVQALIDKYDEAEVLQSQIKQYYEGNEHLQARCNSFEQIAADRLQAILQQQQAIEQLQIGSENQLAYIQQQQQAIEQLQIGSENQLAYIQQQQQTIEKLVSKSNR